MSKKKIRPSALPAAQIPAVAPGRAEIKMSFKHLDLTHGKFNVNGCDTGYFKKLLERFKIVCGLTHVQLQTTHREPLRCHPHEWTGTSEPFGFGIKGQLAECEGWQFQLSSNEHGRVHGFFIGDIFFVVWLDPKHQLYP